MVRAKITVFQISQCAKNDKNINTLQTDLHHFITLAHQYTKNCTPSLTITYGVSASGKSLYTAQLMTESNTIRLRSDIIREKPDYTPHAIEVVYAKLEALAQTLLRAGLNVIIDATCLKQWQRKLFSDLAEKLHVSFKILSFSAPLETLQQRLAYRKAQQQDVSQADEKVLTMQLATLEKLTEEEQKWTTEISNNTIEALRKPLL